MRQIAFASAIAIFTGLLPQVLCDEPASVSQLLEQSRSRPSDWNLLQRIAIAYTQAGQFGEAARFYRRVIALNPGFLPAQKNLGVVLWYMNRRAESEAQFRKLLPVIPTDPVPHLYLGLAHYDRRQMAQAKVQFALAGELASNNPEVLPAVLDSYLATKDFSLVDSVLQVAAGAESASLTKTLATVLNRNRMYEASIRLLSADAQSTAESDALLSEALDGTGQSERAYALLAKSVDRNPENESGYAALAKFASLHQNYPYALEVLERGLSHIPASPVLLVQKGLLLALGGDRVKAAQSFDSAAHANPAWQVPMLSRGVLELEDGNSPQAAETFRKVILLAPDESNGYYFCALALSRTGEVRRAEAITLLRKAIAIAPDDVKSYLLLGKLELAAGRVRLAIAHWEAALRAEPDNPTALYQLGLAYRKVNNAASAEQRMAAFRRTKADAQSEPAALAQVLKVLR